MVHGSWLRRGAVEGCGLHRGRVGRSSTSAAKSPARRHPIGGGREVEAIASYEPGLWPSVGWWVRFLGLRPRLGWIRAFGPKETPGEDEFTACLHT